LLVLATLPVVRLGGGRRAGNMAQGEVQEIFSPIVSFLFAMKSVLFGL
jgi:hypothetical protein